MNTRGTIVLFVTHKPKQCGVYEFGKNIFWAISSSSKYHFIKAECDSINELHAAVKKYKPAIIIYNYHPSVLPWIATKVSKGIYKNNIAGTDAIQIGIIHEITQQVADSATNYDSKWILGRPEKLINCLFDFYIAADPTLLLKNPIVFKTGRLLPAYNNIQPSPARLTIGSFGFATPKKGFRRVVQKTQEEFDEATIRINMPYADFGDVTGSNARRIAEECRELIYKPDIKLEVSHKFMQDNELLDFLAANSINVFMYEDTEGRGLSGAVDNALAVKRPLAVSRCPMFRHVLNVKPSICVEDVPLKEILHHGFAPLEKLVKDWNKENLQWEYERILDKILFKASYRPKKRMGVTRIIQSSWRRFFSLPDKSFTWLRNTDAVTEDNLTVDKSIHYTPVNIPAGKTLNRILDDGARELYAPAIKKLIELVPVTVSKKIARANVQQAFVFDTVNRFLKEFDDPKLLCAGSYEDTASMSLQKMGFVVTDIDPMINYSLQEFYTHPSTCKASYDIIFSTSVIEHDPDDESFMKCIAGLLKPNGIAVLTCDYKDGWKPGDAKPEVDERFYTKHDLEKRLLSYVLDCKLIDQPDWNCPAPDFNYLGKYQYTFASFVIRKK
jgi:SAM-dependent methyltransferase